jgi:hypothetical protein
MAAAALLAGCGARFPDRQAAARAGSARLGGAEEKDKAGALLTGLKLSRARGWLIEHPTQLTAQERGFIQASIRSVEAEERRKARTRRLVTLGSLAAAAVLAVFAVFASLAEQHAQKSATAARESERHPGRFTQRKFSLRSRRRWRMINHDIQCRIHNRRRKGYWESQSFPLEYLR